MTKEPLEPITVRLSTDTITAIDTIISNDKSFDDRSDFIRKTIENKIKRYKK